MPYTIVIYLIDNSMHCTCICDEKYMGKESSHKQSVSVKREKTITD